jgi:hypothetical protein
MTFGEPKTSGAGGSLGAVEQAGPAHPGYTVGAVGFGSCWEQEPTLRELYDIACATIVRQESEAEELRARVAVLEEEQRILTRKHAPRLTDEELREEVHHKYEADRVGGHEWGNI